MKTCGWRDNLVKETTSELDSWKPPRNMASKNGTWRRLLTPPTSWLGANWKKTSSSTPVNWHGSSLIISSRTVDGHIRSSIFKKAPSDESEAIAYRLLLLPCRSKSPMMSITFRSFMNRRSSILDLQNKRIVNFTLSGISVWIRWLVFKIEMMSENEKFYRNNLTTKGVAKATERTLLFRWFWVSIFSISPLPNCETMRAIWSRICSPTRCKLLCNGQQPTLTRQFSHRWTCTVKRLSSKAKNRWGSLQQ